MVETIHCIGTDSRGDPEIHKSSGGTGRGGPFVRPASGQGSLTGDPIGAPAGGIRAFSRRGPTGAHACAEPQACHPSGGPRNSARVGRAGRVKVWTRGAGRSGRPGVGASGSGLSGGAGVGEVGGVGVVEAFRAGGGASGLRRARRAAAALRVVSGRAWSCARRLARCATASVAAMAAAARTRAAWSAVRRAMARAAGGDSAQSATWRIVSLLASAMVASAMRGSRKSARSVANSGESGSRSAAGRVMGDATAGRAGSRPGGRNVADLARAGASESEGMGLCSGEVTCSEDSEERRSCIQMTAAMER